MIVTGSAYGKIFLTSALTGELIETISADEVGVEACSYSADGRLVLSWNSSGILNFAAPRDYAASIKVWQTDDPAELATLFVPTSISTLDIAPGSCSIVCGDSHGRVLAIRALGIECAGPAVTLVYLFPFDTGEWDDSPTARCEWCGQRLTPSQAVIAAIREMNERSSPRVDERKARGPLARLIRHRKNKAPRATSAGASAEALHDPRLLTECPLCHRPLRFNPFIVDNRDRY
jgi:hypothetical protein